MRFKDYIELQEGKDTALLKWEDLLHHIAEEELVACKVHEIVMGSKSGANHTTINFIADCNDDPRKEGYQADLSKKLTLRLARHNMPGLGAITAKVYHKNIDPR
jgi:hypothetical protein